MDRRRRPCTGTAEWCHRARAGIERAFEQGFGEGAGQVCRVGHLEDVEPLGQRGVEERRDQEGVTAGRLAVGRLADARRRLGQGVHLDGQQHRVRRPVVLGQRVQAAGGHPGDRPERHAGVHDERAARRLGGLQG